MWGSGGGGELGQAVSNWWSERVQGQGCVLVDYKIERWHYLFRKRWCHR